MKSVSTRLLMIMLMIAITGMGLIALVGTVLAGKALGELSLERIDLATTFETQRIDAWIDRQLGYVEAIDADLSSRPDVSPETLLPSLIRHADDNEDYFSVYVGYNDGSAVFNDEWVPDESWISTQRDWYRGAESDPEAVHITELYSDADTGNLCLTLAKAFWHEGTIGGVVAVDIFTNVLQDIIDEATIGENSYSFLTDSEGNIIAHYNTNYNPTIDENEDVAFQNITEIEDGIFAGLINSDVLDGKTIELKEADGSTYYFTARIIPAINWIIYSAIPKNIVNAPIYEQITISVIVLVIVLFGSILLIYFSLRNMITRPVKDVTEAANLLASGETGVNLEGSYVGEIALLADSFRGMEMFNSQQTHWLEDISNGDLSTEVTSRGENDHIGIAIDSMLSRLNSMFRNINMSATQVAYGSKQIADGAQALAQSSTEQAESVSELSNTVEEIARRTNENADIAGKTSKLSASIKTSAEKGSRQMNELIAAVKDINDASRSIGNIIKTIDDIAFQTNILALNAAVEAARAGQHGKGFAVVAEEVRNLASKSAEAANNTGSIIQNSMEKAELGFHIAEETAESLKEIVSGINESSYLIEEITKASEEQSSSIASLNRGIDQVTQAVHQNSATAQESAAVSEEMSSQSNMLQQMIQQFKLKENIDGYDALPPSDYAA